MDFKRPIALLCSKISRVITNCVRDTSYSICTCEDAGAYVDVFNVKIKLTGLTTDKKITYMHVNHFITHLTPFSLYELLILLYQLIPFASHCSVRDCASISYLPEIKTLIRGVEREMNPTDDHKNNIDLIIINNELKNENERIKAKLDNMTKLLTQ